MIEKNKLITVGAILVLGVIAFVYTRQTPAINKEVPDDANKIEVIEETPVTPEEAATEDTVPTTKEFAIESFYDDKGMWFSLKEISVNKGDAVKITVKNIKGSHDFVIDKYGINKATPLNEEVVIEFIADKAGEFIYYCSMPGHREKGQWGTLKVSE